MGALSYDSLAPMQCCATTSLRTMSAGSAPNGTDVLVEEVDTEDLGFLSGLARAPCFRETALYSIGGSGTLAALHFHRNRDVMRSAELMVKSGVAFATLHWCVCAAPSNRGCLDLREASELTVFHVYSTFDAPSIPRRLICRKRYYDEREATYGALEAQKKVAMAKRAAFAKAARGRAKTSDE